MPNILVPIKSFLSTLNAILVPISKSDSGYSIFICWIFKIKSNYHLSDLPLVIHLLNIAPTFQRWRKPKHALRLKFTNSSLWQEYVHLLDTHSACLDTPLLFALYKTHVILYPLALKPILTELHHLFLLTYAGECLGPLGVVAGLGNNRPLAGGVDHCFRVVLFRASEELAEVVVVAADIKADLVRVCEGPPGVLVLVPVVVAVRKRSVLARHARNK